MASDIRHLYCILFVWTWSHQILKQMIPDTGCQHDRVQSLSYHHDSTSHVHIKSNGHTKLVITNTMELDKARSFYSGCFHTRILPPCKLCCQVRFIFISVRARGIRLGCTSACRLIVQPCTSPWFRRSHFRHQSKPRPRVPQPSAPMPTRETLVAKGGTCGRELSGNFA